VAAIQLKNLNRGILVNDNIERKYRAILNSRWIRLTNDDIPPSSTRDMWIGGAGLFSIMMVLLLVGLYCILYEHSSTGSLSWIAGYLLLTAAAYVCYVLVYGFVARRNKLRRLRENRERK